MKNFYNKYQKAFTLAETLTTLTIIGVIAALVIPGLNTDVNLTVNEKSKTVFENKLDFALHNMQTKGLLVDNYDTTDSFVEALAKHIQISKTCDKSHLTQCFATKIKSSSKTVKYNVSELSKTADIGVSDFDSDLNGIMFNNGMTALIAYNPQCSIPVQFDVEDDVKKCMVMYYDTNGVKGPNIIGMDINIINSTENAEDEFIESVGQPFYPSVPVYYEHCTELKNKGYPITYCISMDDYYVAAVKQCYNEGKRLPTSDELTKIANNLYGQDVKVSGTTTDLTISNNELAAKLGITSSSGSTVFLTSEEYSSDLRAPYARVAGRTFSATATNPDNQYGNGYRKKYANKFFCVGKSGE